MTRDSQFGPHVLEPPGNAGDILDAHTTPGGPEERAWKERAMPVPGWDVPHDYYAPDEDDEHEADINIDSVARHCARPIRGCATDEQYQDVVARISQAIADAMRAQAPRGRGG